MKPTILRFLIGSFSCVALLSCTARSGYFLQQECIENSDCAGTCVQGACQELSTTDEICDDFADCETGHSCVENACKKQNGQNCNTDDECANTCIQGACQNTGTIYGNCDDDLDCGANLACGLNQCGLSDGQACSVDTECRNFCVSGQCGDPVGVGETCQTSSSCTGSLVCVANVCVLPNGSACTQNSQCESVCLVDTCGSPSGVQGACDEDLDCSTGFQCVAQACLGTTGQTCSSNSDCIETCIQGTCSTPSGDGGACDDGPDCSVGLFCVASACSTCNPVAEVCEDGYDNDCDGNVNNGCVPSACRAVTNITDDFDDNTIGTAWEVSASGGSVTESGSTINLTPQAGTPSHVYLRSKRRFDLVGSSALVEVVRVASTGATFFEIQSTEFSAAISYESPFLNAYYFDPAPTTETVNQIAWDPQADPGTHRWWRIREDSGTIFWETSSDGITFSPFASRGYSFAPSWVKVSMDAQTSSAEPSPDTAQFDNFNGGDLPGSGTGLESICSMAEFSDDFEDNQVSSRWTTVVDPGGVVAELFGTMNLNAPQATAGLVHVFSHETYDFTNNSAFTHILALPGDPNVVTELSLWNGGTDAIEFSIDGSTLSAAYSVMGTPTTVASTPFLALPSAHSYLRISTDGANNVIWETSSDGSSWGSPDGGSAWQANIPGFPFDSLYLRLATVALGANSGGDATFETVVTQ